MQGKRRGVTQKADCVTLGRLLMDGILPAPARTPKFQVEFDVQSSGTVKVLVSNTRTNDRPQEFNIVEKHISVYVDEKAAHPQEETNG